MMQSSKVGAVVVRKFGRPVNARRLQVTRQRVERVII
jgi:hypothetical protein